MIPTAPGNTTPVCLSGPLHAEKIIYIHLDRERQCETNFIF